MNIMKNTLLMEVGEISASIETAVRSRKVLLSVPFGEQDDILLERLANDIEAASRRVVQTDGK